MRSLIALSILSCMALALAACAPTAPSTAAATPTEAATAPAPAATELPTTAPVVPQTTVQAPATPAATAAAAPTAEATTSVYAPITGGSPIDAVRNAFIAQGKTKGFRIKQTIVGAGNTLTNTIEVVPPDRARLVTGNGQAEAILIGNTVYANIGGTWRQVPQVPGLTGQTLLMTDPASINAFLSNATNMTTLGPATINGTPTNGYQFNYSVSQTVSGTTVAATGVEKVWVGVSDGLPYRVEQNGTANVGGQAVSADTTLDYYDYNANITINPPTP